MQNSIKFVKCAKMNNHQDREKIKCKIPRKCENFPFRSKILRPMSICGLVSPHRRRLLAVRSAAAATEGAGQWMGGRPHALSTFFNAMVLLFCVGLHFCYIMYIWS